MAAEALQNPEDVAASQHFDDEDTDGYESEEADIFERQRKFEKLLQKFNKHRENGGLGLKGNDLRYNIYMKKMSKLARTDLGLDLAAYKDYVNNLKEFASVNSDLAIFARDSLTADVQLRDKLIVNAASDFMSSTLEGSERVAQHGGSVSFTL